MNIYRILLPLLFVGCATTLEQSLDKVATGMDKSDVLEIAGSPWITRRSNSRDAWIYRFYQDEEEYRRQLTFFEGKVISIGRALPASQGDNQLEESDSMQEFEKAARKRQKSHNDGFRDLEEQK